MASNAVLQHNNPVMTAQGLFHDLDVYPDHLVIHRTDFISRVLGSDELIAYNDIARMFAYKSLFLMDSWSQLIIVSTNGTSRALTYNVQQQQIAQKVKDIIEDFLSRR